MEIDEISCRQLVELVTEYLEGGLLSAERTRFEEHLALCEGCRAHVEQMRETIRVTGALALEPLGDQAIAELCRAFRDWTRS